MRQTAEVMNDLFVNIKVDREERPDIDQIYMSALHHLGEHGGWRSPCSSPPTVSRSGAAPISPRPARYGKPPSSTLLREVERVFRQEPQSVAQNSSASWHAWPRRAAAGRVIIAAPELDRAAQSDRRPDRSGPRRHARAPKFPQPDDARILWRAGQRHERQRYFAAVELSLARMCEGGIYDISAAASRATRSTSAGWCRISRRCSTTMRLLLDCSRSPTSARPMAYSDPARETVAWLAREMTTGGRVLRLARRRLRRRGGQILRLVARRDRAVPRRRTRRSLLRTTT
jgi:uncharacterized protein YyaL (SSP411 family)